MSFHTIKGNLLIVEDDPGTAELEARRLQRLGHTVMTAANTEMVLNLIEQHRFDLIVLDYGLEGDVSGLAIFMILKERGSSIPAILVTGLDDPKILTQAIRAGVRDFVPKTPDYLEDLSIAVERVMRQITLERQAVESIALREKQEQLQAAFDAASLTYWDLDLVSNSLRWSGHYQELFGTSEAKLHNLGALLQCIFEADRAEFLSAFENSKHRQGAFDHQFRIVRADGVTRWVHGKGRFSYNNPGVSVRMTGILFDFTEQRASEISLQRSTSQISALNERLQLSLSEINHRVKSSLQVVTSILNIEVRKYGALTAEQVSKVVAQIQGIATLHDVLMEQARHDGEIRTVALDQVLRRVLDVLERACEGREIIAELEPCAVTAKEAATLSVILNELISNALKHGSGAIEISLNTGDTEGTLCVTNEGSSFPPGFEPPPSGRTGLTLLCTLCRADLNSDPVFENTATAKARVVITFPRKHVGVGQNVDQVPITLFQ